MTCDGYAAETGLGCAYPKPRSACVGLYLFGGYAAVLECGCVSPSRASLVVVWLFGNYADVVAVNVGITDFIFMLVLWMLTA